ncbi:hypothetical protein Nepgr_021721 [Nepenthes gracilis]|uniref:Uncharacterized protein n=1 Tax=Nepenthes gracilis TaxID=150966 RepID=A0AAD3SXZ1_NEPGR|nr:hypothetical protein Nepgr_021721 [Nepenthes gracilis]
MIGMSVSPPLTHSPARPRGLSWVVNAALESLDSFTYKNLIDLSQVAGASEGAFVSLILLNEDLGSLLCQNMQTHIDALSGSTNTYVSETVSTLGVNGLPGCFVDDLECSYDAAMWTMFLVRFFAVVGAGWVFFAPRCLCRFCCEAFYVAEASVAAHGFEFTIVLLSGHVKGGPALLLMGFAGCFATQDDFEISGTSLADRC